MASSEARRSSVRPASPGIIRPIPLRPQPRTLTPIPSASKPRPSSISRPPTPQQSSSFAHRFPTPPPTPPSPTSKGPRPSSARPISGVRPSSAGPPSYSAYGAAGRAKLVARARGPPSHLSFMTTKNPPPYPNIPRIGTEGKTLGSTNLIWIQGSLRHEPAFFLRWIAEKLCDALERGIEMLDRLYSYLAGSRILTGQRETVEKDVRVMKRAVLGVLRFFDSTLHIYQAHADVTYKLLHIRWGDIAEWNRLSDCYQDMLRPMAKEAKQSVLPIRDLINHVLRHHQRFNSGWNANLLNLSARYMALPDFCTSLVRDLTLVLGYSRQLYDAWNVESQDFLSRTLFKRAQKQVDSSAWYGLQWRSRCMIDGLEVVKKARVKLTITFERYLDEARSRAGISGREYIEIYRDFLPLVPLELRQRVFCKRNLAYPPPPPAQPQGQRPTSGSGVRPSSRGSSPSRTFPRGILKPSSPEGAFDGKTTRRPSFEGDGIEQRRPFRSFSPLQGRSSSVERYGRTG